MKSRCTWMKFRCTEQNISKLLAFVKVIPIESVDWVLLGTKSSKGLSHILVNFAPD
jgi:hypothetical protein